jgi:hypothetical protein
MSDDLSPETQPSGSLDPPRRPPPTAVATSAPLPPEPLSGPVRWLPKRTGLGRIIDQALDVLDAIGDSVRDALVRR